MRLNLIIYQADSVLLLLCGNTCINVAGKLLPGVTNVFGHLCPCFVGISRCDGINQPVVIRDGGV
jgi:hypothetical protein